MKTFPNAKINIGLRVLRKRPDGYHDLETLFVPYHGLRDELEIVPADGESEFRIVWDDGTPVGWPVEKDLCVKAYRLLQSEFGLPPVRLQLTKRIPVGAGLGGGSADAAFTLKMLDAMFSLGLGDSRLAAYASLLGSDCSFFIYNRYMMGRGRGEILEDFDLDLDGYEIRVLVPEGVSVNTADAYRGIVPREPDDRLEDLLALPVSEWKGAVVNDFETTVFKKYGILADIKDKLYSQGALYASMSGSGSAMYGIFLMSKF